MTGGSSRRAWLAVLGVVVLTRCGADSCSCLAPLDGPFPQSEKINQVVQARITPEGFNFVSQKLPQILGTFAKTSCDGSGGVACPSGMTCQCPPGETCDQCPSTNRLCTLTNPRECTGGTVATPTIGFRVPPVSENFSDGDRKTRVCTTDRDLSWDNCRLYIKAESATLTPTNTTDLKIEFTMDITSPARPNGIKMFYDTGQAFYEPSATCTLYPNVNNRVVTGTLRVTRDAATDRAKFELANMDIPFSGDDIEIYAEDGEDTVRCFTLNIGFIKDIVIGQVKDTLTESLVDAVAGFLEPIQTQACDHRQSGYQCPRLANGEQTVCANDDKCHFASGSQGPIPGLLGMEGKLSLAGSLPDFLVSRSDIDFTAYAGGTRTGGGSAAHFTSGGLNLGMVGGAATTDNDCVPPRPSLGTSVPSYAFPTTITPAAGGTAAPYMAGIVVSDLFLGEVLGEAYSSGLLCQEVGTAQVGLINSGIIGLVLGESSTVAELTGSDTPPRPVIIEIKPNAVPEAHVGLGTQSPDPSDPTRTILDQPLLAVSIPDLDLDFYTLVDDRYVRLVTLNVDLALGLGLELTAQNQVHLVADPVDRWIRAVRVRNAEILSQSAAEIEQAVPELLATFLPQFAPNLDQVFDLPELQGFELRNVRLRGTGSSNGMTALGKTRYPFLGLFADLAFNAANVNPMTVRAETVAEVDRVVLPAPERMDARLGSARERVKALLRVKSFMPTGDAELEHSYRVDNGFWHPYHRGTELWLSDVELNLQGWHTVQVRSRVVGEPETLDQDPVELRILSDVEAPRLTARRDADVLNVEVSDRVSEPEALMVSVRARGGEWVNVPGGSNRQLALSSDLDPTAFIEIRARDEVGHETLTSVGDPAWVPGGMQRARTAATQPGSSAAEGCGSCTSTGAPVTMAWVLLGLLFARRRGR